MSVAEHKSAHLVLRMMRMSESVPPACRPQPRPASAIAQGGDHPPSRRATTRPVPPTPLQPRPTYIDNGACRDIGNKHMPRQGDTDLDCGEDGKAGGLLEEHRRQAGLRATAARLGKGAYDVGGLIDVCLEAGTEGRVAPGAHNAAVRHVVHGCLHCFADGACTPINTINA